MNIKKSLNFFLCLLISYKVCWCFFLFSSPEEKARKYLSLSLEEYRKAIKEKPTNIEILEEYRKLLEYKIGKTEAKVEIALIFQEINLTSEVYRILLEISISERENALKYIEKRIEKSQNIKEKIDLYTLATVLSPQNPSYWYNLGSLFLGINRAEEGISALEKAYNYNFKEVPLFYYLALYYFQDYKNDRNLSKKL